MDSNILKIIGGVVPWIKEHYDHTAGEELLQNLLDELLKHASCICFPTEVASDLFKKQLCAIVRKALSQYMGSKIGCVQEELVFDISEILYNELTFTQLVLNNDNRLHQQDHVVSEQLPPSN